MMKTSNVNIKKHLLGISLALAVAASGGCNGYLQSNNASQLFYALFFSTSPVLNPLTLSGTSSTSITLAQPTFFSTGNPAPTSVLAYIGPDGLITITGSTVGGTITEGPVDVSAGPYTFNGLAGNTIYRVYVVAQNSSGYSVATITQSTGGIAPVMAPLVITATDYQSITLQMPTFTTAGNPLPPTQTRFAYIGLDGAISVNYTTGVVAGEIGALTQDLNVALIPFAGLTPNTAYRIIVVAQNTSGVSIREIVQNTDNTPPVMAPLVITATDYQSITLQMPAFTTAGNPLPPTQTRFAYIGLDGAISVNYTTGVVAGEIGALTQDLNVALIPFAGLTPNTAYRIIVVAQNVAGLSIREIAQNTGNTPPVMAPLVITGTDYQSITLQMPAFTTAGNPGPPVQTRTAYIGLDGAISVNYTTGVVAGEIGALTQDLNVALIPFAGLTPNTAYRIIVVAQNVAGLSIREIAQNTGNTPPVMAPLVITATDYQSITLQMPAFTTAGNPGPPVQTRTAYIGLDGAISVNYTTGVVAGEIGALTQDLNVALIPFTGLTPNTAYRIIVVAQNVAGLSIREIAQNTGNTPPVMAPLVITGTDYQSITLQMPTFTTAGNPLPPTQTRFAYIGLDGAISVNYTTGVVAGEIGALTQDLNVALIPFAGLTANTAYRIIVVAQNTSGVSIREIAQITAYSAPVLRPLFVSEVNTGNITLEQPTFSTAGNPAPSVLAYIGYDGTIAIAGFTPTGTLAGPINVAASGTTFGGLFANTAYRIIVVAQNASGYSVRQVAITTGSGGVTAPVLDPLDVTTTPPTAATITLTWPTHSTPGNPAQTVTAYIGLDGVISVSGTTVVGSTASADVTLVGTTFGGLTTGTTYCIIVVSQNTTGYSVRRVTVSTL